MTEPLCVTLPNGRLVSVHREDASHEPTRWVLADDNCSVKSALAQMRDGADLLWTGDWHQGRRLVQGLARRIQRPAKRTGELAAIWRSQREVVSEVARLTNRVWVLVEPDGRVGLRRAPDTSQAVEWAFGSEELPRVVSLKTLLGALSAAGWTREGIWIDVLNERIYPRFGVFPPTRQAYVEVLSATRFDGLDVLDTGCGTGVLGLLAAKNGARSVLGVDLEPRAIACANDNATRMGLDKCYRAFEADLFPKEGLFDVILFNPPWLPETPRTRLDRAVYAEDALILQWLNGLSRYLSPSGWAGLIISDLDVRLGLRPEGWLHGAVVQAGLTMDIGAVVPARHRGAKNKEDPLFEARSAEQISLVVLRRAPSQQPAGEE